MNSIFKSRFASQVVEKNALTNSITPHSWPQVRESVFEKPHHEITSGPSRNNLKTVSIPTTKEYVISNNMVPNYYLEEAKKKAQLQKDKALNSKPSVTNSTRLPNTNSGSKLKPKKTY
ncbi:hypothetical protein Tco_0724765 [Tanacetum coccineum]|uniref:Uncharacterized protein n=1 Tax=Tanacetum coccineum TaxID=301880 RepID=A0ABQ4YB03_9ASTR